MVTPKPTEDGGADFTMQGLRYQPRDDFTVQYSIEDPFGWEIAGAVRPSDNTAVTPACPRCQFCGAWTNESVHRYRPLTAPQRGLWTRLPPTSASVPSGHARWGFSINGVPTRCAVFPAIRTACSRAMPLTAEEHYDDAHDHQGAGCQHHPSGPLSAQSGLLRCLRSDRLRRLG